MRAATVSYGSARVVFGKYAWKADIFKFDSIRFEVRCDNKFHWFACSCPPNQAVQNLVIQIVYLMQLSATGQGSA